MSELQVIEQALVKASRRRRRARALRGMIHGLFTGGVVCLLLVLLYILAPVPVNTLMVAGMAPVAGALLGILIGGWKANSLAETARWVDAQTALKERLSTALELASSNKDETWKHLVISDAAAHAQEVDAKKLVSFRLPGMTRWALLVLALAAGLGFVPEYRSKAHLQEKVDEEIIKDTGRRLAELTRRNLEKRTPALPATQKSLEAVNEVGDKLAKANLTRGEALKDLASVTDKLKDQLNNLGKDPSLKRLAEAARRAGGTGGQTPPGAQKQMEALQQKLGENPPSADKLDELRRKLEDLQSVARAMASDPSSVSDQQRAQASQAMSELSRQAESMGLDLPQLDAALEALAAQNSDLFLKEMDAALRDLDKLREMAKTLQQLKQSGEPPGKDLAEQLERGQPETAASTLRSMVKQLQEGSLSAEQMKGLMAEVQKAVKPAGNYGKVSEHLRKATNNMNAGKRAEASQNLADAAKELEELMQQMEDAQMMMTQLSALQQASMCIGTGQSWAACRRPGTKPGGKPGAGVGTWADDIQEWDGSTTDHWDNSGLVRPDMAPRGLTEREKNFYPEDALKPTRVKGQFSPGGEMPSISLKGVSIKGQSAVDYRAAATAAQSEAESALSQEKVPKMYQGTVREYFDDLKK